MGTPGNDPPWQHATLPRSITPSSSNHKTDTVTRADVVADDDLDEGFVVVLLVLVRVGGRESGVDDAGEDPEGGG